MGSRFRSVPHSEGEDMRKFLSALLFVMLATTVAFAQEGKTIDIVFGGSTTDEELLGSDEQQMIGAGINIPVSDRFDVEVWLCRGDFGDVEDSHVYGYTLPVSLQFNFRDRDSKVNFYVGGGGSFQITEGFEGITTTITEELIVNTIPDPSDPTAKTNTETTTTVEIEDRVTDEPSLNYHASIGTNICFSDRVPICITADARRVWAGDEDAMTDRFEYVIGLRLPFPG